MLSGLVLVNFYIFTSKEVKQMSEVEWMDIFGDNLRDILKEQNMSRRELAQVLDLSEATISNYINKKQMPTMEVIVNMAYELSMSIDELIDFGDTVH
jgi:plasmid maintenance system antidote protein VapI